MTLVLLTLVTVEVAGDVDAFASHHHNFVSYKEKQKHEGVTMSYRANDHRVLNIPSQMVVHVSFLMVVKLKQNKN